MPRWKNVWLSIGGTFPKLLYPLAIILLLAGCNQNSNSKDVPPVSKLAISISEEGIYRLTLPQINDAGIDIDQLTTEEIRLSTEGKTIPLLIRGEELLFYGTVSQNRYTDRQTYFLESNKSGKTMGVLPTTSEKGAADTFAFRGLHFEENNLYDGRASSSQAEVMGYSDPWFWLTLQAQEAKDVTFNLPEEILPTPMIRLGLWGVTSNNAERSDHDFDLYLNDLYLDTVKWDGETYHIAEIEIPAQTLIEGVNRVLLDNKPTGNVPIDIMRLDWIEVDFPYLTLMTSDHIRVNYPGTLTINGELDDDSVILDVNNPYEPVLLSNWDNSEGKISFQVDQPSDLFISPAEYFVEPHEITPVVTTALRDENNQADFIIVVDKDYVAPLNRLADYRRSQGLAVNIVPIQEIVDEFGNGRLDPNAVKAFIQYAAKSWSDPKPQYLLIAGDATIDYKGYLGSGLASQIPSSMIPVTFGGETISDAQLADVDGDEIPDIAIGRWPVEDLAHLNQIIDRTIAYEEQPLGAQALFISDASSGVFSAMSDEFIVAGDFDDDQVSNLVGPDIGQLTSSWNSGSWLVTYIGHGSLDRWGQNSIMTSEDVKRLNSEFAPPISIQLTCLTGLFAHPIETSLSEEMLLYQSGPVLVISATSLTLSSSQRPFGEELIKQIVDPNVVRIGDALQNAILRVGVSGDPSMKEVIETFGLLGDPTTKIRRPD